MMSGGRFKGCVLNNENRNATPVPGWLKTMRTKRKQPDADWDYDPTPMALVVACFGGTCGLCTAALLYEGLTESGSVTIPWLPPWRAHMAIACVGVVSSIVSLYFLEVLGRRSKRKAWKSSASWLPLVAVTGSATAIHIPTYVVILVGTLCGGWAYRRTRAIR
jgi:hypothetical protein